MDLVYSIGINISISNVEAGLLHKYLKMHPIDSQYIGRGHFAFSFSEFEQKKEFELMLNSESIDSCVRVLEDQDLNDPLENVLKKQLLEKIYYWSDIIYNEQRALDKLENDYYLNSPEEFYNKDFSIENFIKLCEVTESNRIIANKKPARSILKRIRYFLNI
ncbi:hypothetical protein [Sphingobacterium sp. 40-24]|uniref:hypothetical protein n=1 Tax=Sphingobacterium sp. 40-24 TaxID=1895843 RepID=UPI000962358C|nr:hypothetical protein [Sphingobacterium sp. 40-24]OJZ07798.1 MAG: hypothetical protein BGP15_15670 [Sphingobacterium sp. 40-24]